MAKSLKIPAGIDRHGEKWRLRINRNGIKVYETFDDFETACTQRHKILAEIRGQTYHDLSEEKQTSLHDLLDLYLKEEVPKKRGIKQQTNMLRAWQREPWAKLPIISIKSSHITEWRNRRVAEGVAPSTISNPMNQQIGRAHV